MIDQTPALAPLGRAEQVAITPTEILKSRELKDLGKMSSLVHMIEAGGIGHALWTGRPEGLALAGVVLALRAVLSSTPRKLITAATWTTLENALNSGNVGLFMQVAGQTPAIMDKITELNKNLQNVSAK
jgi:hypothetical protein